MEGGRALELFVLSILVAIVSCHVVKEQDAAVQEIGRLFTKRDTAALDYNYKVVENWIPCILANMTFNLSVTYVKKGSQAKPQSDIGYAEVSPSKNITASGYCGTGISYLILKWGTETTKEDNKSEDSSIEFTLYTDNTNFKIKAIDANIYLDPSKITDASSSRVQVSTRNLDLFSAGVKDGIYNCSKEDVKLSPELSLHFTEISLVAFNTEKDYSKRKAVQCSADKNRPTESSSTPNPVTEKPDNTYLYMVTGTDSVICILANMDISVTLTYDTKSSGSKDGTVKVPKDGMTVSGDCGKTSSSMNITWPAEKKSVAKTDSKLNSVKLTFAKDGDSYYVKRINGLIFMDETNFKDAKNTNETFDANNLDLFKTPADHMYKCAPESNTKGDKFEIKFTGVDLIAFNTEKKISARTEENCEHSNAGAIVGGIIGALAIIALIAFVVVMWRRRSR